MLETVSNAPGKNKSSDSAEPDLEANGKKELSKLAISQALGEYKSSYAIGSHQNLSQLKLSQHRLQQNRQKMAKSREIRLAAKAYTVARQEIAIVSGLKHEHIVAMVGLSVRPLAIVLELAPLGNLKDLLSEFRVAMCKVWVKQREYFMWYLEYEKTQI